MFRDSIRRVDLTYIPASGSLFEAKEELCGEVIVEVRLAASGHGCRKDLNLKEET